MSAAVAARRPADLDELLRGLVVLRDERFAPPAWLTAAYDDPAAFWASVGSALLAAPGGAARSSLSERYHLFHDLGARHAVGRRIALVTHDDAAGFRRWSYADLVEDARVLATAWRARGVRPGACVAIVEPSSPAQTSALLAAWHCGAIAAPIPAWGRVYVLDRLAALAPDVVATTASRALWLELDDEAVVPSGALAVAVAPAASGAGARVREAGPHLYAPDEVALRVFSPLGANALVPLDVPAEGTLLGALRDGALLLRLAPDAALAAPGISEACDGLSLRLAAMSCGAHVVDLALDDVVAQPALLDAARLDVLGVHPALRDALIGRSEEIRSGPARWFRSPAGLHEPDAWGRLAASPPFARSLAATYCASPSAGGAIAFSPWRRTAGLNTVVPAPGRAWQLLDPNGSGMPALDGTGVLTCVDPGVSVDAIGSPLLGAHGGESLWLSSLGAHRDGERLPAEEIESLVARRFSWVWACGLVDYARPSAHGALAAALVVFVRPDEEVTASMATEIRSTLELDLAPHLVPDRVDLFTIAPRFTDDGALDVAWCQGQYLSGRLARKQREPLFVRLARLRDACATLDA